MWPWISRVVKQATRDTATGFKLNERNPMLKARPVLGLRLFGYRSSSHAVFEHERIFN